jgi:hypothetical protein
LNLIPSAHFGYSVGTAGDVNGDGYADVILGAIGNQFVWRQRAILHYGGRGAGPSLRPQQRRADGAAPIAPLCTSGSESGFRLAALGRTPFGRGPVKLEWEVKPLGTPLDGSGIEASTSWGEADIDEVVSGLTDNTLYHWRIRLRYHPAITPFQSYSRWLSVPGNGWQEADLRTDRMCRSPNQPVFVTTITLSADVTRSPILHFQDSNEPTAVTGYNVYRSSDPAVALASWPRLASNVNDMDPSTPDQQWVDSASDLPPGGIWYYQVTAYNAPCLVEGPF